MPHEFGRFFLRLGAVDRSTVERYLAARGIDLIELDPWRAEMHAHPNAYHGPTSTQWPCMVCAVRNVDGLLVNAHRTFLHDREPGKAPVNPVRLLWHGVPVKGYAIHLSPPAETMVIGEGIETTASAMKLLGLPGWAAISAPNLADVILSDRTREVVIAADNDADGVGERMALAAAQRFKREGRRARVVRPTCHGDFNDLLLRRSS